MVYTDIMTKINQTPITIFAAGSRGDIQPCLVLGAGLQQAGFSVRFAAPENYAGFVQEYGLEFHPLGGDVQQIMGSETGREFMDTGSANPIRSIRAMRSMLGPVALQMAQDGFEACRPAQALVSLAIFAPFTKSIAEVLDIPLILVEPTPMLPSRAYPAPGWPLQTKLGGLHNRLSGHAMLQVIWQWYQPFVNEFRQRLDLAPLSNAAFYRILRTTPLLGAYSPRVIPRPDDWPDHAHVTGYWFPEGQATWQPPAELMRFLERGDPPVYIGFGSMTGENPEQFGALALEALEKSGQRGLLLTGWGGLQTLRMPENVFVLDTAPHPWLFPRMKVVVHHGGAGTTAEGLRAGVPAVIVPFIVDQSFWGQRIWTLGVGPRPLPRKKLTADKLARAIYTAANDPLMRNHASALGAAIRAEDGVGLAVSLIQQILGA
jgi:UDP:flavonoid glycosyltransferase YjiC (YdhE family)